MCSTKIFNSIGCVVCCLAFATVVLVTSVGTFLMIFSITYQLSNDDTERKRRFESMETELGRSLFAISEGCLRLDGFPRKFAGWMVENDSPDIGSIISILYPYYEMVVKELGEKITFGVWTHLYDGATEQQAAFFFDYGEYVYTNITHTLVLEIEKPEIHGFYKSHNYTVSYSTSPRYAGADHSFYRTRHKLYEYWVGGKPFIPYMSFSIGTGLFEDLGNATSGEVLAGNIWYGSDIVSFSDYLRSITPPDTYSWLIEVKRDFLLAVSDDGASKHLIIDSFLSPEEYTYNPTITKFSAELSENPNFLEDIKSGVMTELTHDNVNYMFKYWNVTDLGAEWILVNAKDHWAIFRLSYLTIFITTLCLFLLSCVGCCWCVFSCRVVRHFFALRNQMKKIDDMDLENISFPCSCCTFMEIHFLQKRFLKMTSQLQEYKAFLPEILLDDDATEQVSSDYSASGRSNATIKSESRSTSASNNDRLSDGTNSTGECCSSSEGSDSGNNSSANSVTFSRLTNTGKFSLGVLPRDLLVVNLDFRFGKSVSKTYDCILSSLERKKGLLFEFDLYSISIIISNKRDTFAFLLISHLKASLMRKDLLGGLVFFVVRDTGYIGNLGNKRMKKFFFGGGVKQKIEQMKARIPSITTSATFVCENVSPSLVGSYVMRVCNEEYDCQVGPATSIKDDEWMYEMEEQEKLRQWEEYNVGTDCYFEGDYGEAITHFQKYLQNMEDDIFASQWVNKCELEIKKKLEMLKFEVQEEEREQKIVILRNIRKKCSLEDTFKMGDGYNPEEEKDINEEGQVEDSF